MSTQGGRIRTFISVLVLCSWSIYFFAQSLQNSGQILVMVDDKFEKSLQDQHHPREEEVMLCQIPQLNSHSKIMMDLVDEQFRDEGQNRVPHCVGDHSDKFLIDFDSNLVRLDSSDDDKNDLVWSTINCYFQQYRRDPGKLDFEFILGPIRKITANVTRLEDEYEFLRLHCYDNETVPDHSTELERHGVVHRTTFAHVPIKKSVVDRHKKLFGPLPVPNETIQNMSVSKMAPQSPPPKHMSMIILGIDMVSHHSFIRSMPNSYKFLKEKMAAVDFTAFNSMGWVSWDSLIPLLTGMSQSELRRHCMWVSYYRGYRLDECPFVWKKFKELGYATSYCDEDAYGIRPFRRSPSLDYDYRHFIYKHTAHSSVCMGRRLTFEIHLDIIRRLAHRFKNDRPYFHFSWTQTLTHDVSIYGRYGDAPLLNLLTELRDNGLLENTAIIVVADHGLRDGVPRTQSSQGYFEERLPILMMALPPNFESQFPAAMANFKKNQHRFTTALDVHATLHDLSNLNDLTDRRIEDRSRKNGAEMEVVTSKHFFGLGEKFVVNGKGVSLFLPISAHRKCDSFYPTMDPNFCACLPQNPSTQSIAADSPIVQMLANYLIQHLNENLTPFGQKCERFGLVSVTEVKIYSSYIESFSRPRYLVVEKLFLKSMPRNFTDLYEIGVQATPPGSHFRAYMTFIEDDSKRGNNRIEVLSVTSNVGGFQKGGGHDGCINFDDEAENEFKRHNVFCHCAASNCSSAHADVIHSV